METRLYTTSPRRAFGHRFVVSAPDPDLATHLEEVFGSLPSCDGPDLRRYDLAGPDQHGRWSARVDAEPIREPTSQATALGLVLWHINRSAIESRTSEVLLHAGAVRVADAGVLLPGGMEVGKTTLVAGLLRAGAGYLTDEAVAVGTDGVSGLTKALSLDPGSWHLFPELEAVPSSVTGPWHTAQWQVPPERFRCAEVVVAVQPAVIVFPRYMAGGATRVRPIDGGEALLRLASNVFPNVLGRRETLQRLSWLLDHGAAFDVSYDRLDDAVRVVADLAMTRGRRDDAQVDPAGEVSLGLLEGVGREGHRAVGASHGGYVVPHDDVAFIRARDEALLHREDIDELLQLNATGTLAWHLARGGVAIAELSDHLASIAGAPSREVHPQVAAFVEDLVSRGLATIVPGPSAT